MSLEHVSNLLDPAQDGDRTNATPPTPINGPEFDSHLGLINWMHFLICSIYPVFHLYNPPLGHTISPRSSYYLVGT